MADDLVDVMCEKEMMINVDGNTVKIMVGEGDEMRCFHVHEGVLRSCSPFFDAALSKEWKEGQDHAIALPEEDGEVFYNYVQLLYSGKVMKGNGKDTSTFIDAIVLTSRTAFPDDEGEMHTWYPTGATLHIIYMACPESSPARKFVVDMHVNDGDQDWVKDDTPPEFLKELSKALLVYRQLTQRAKKQYEELSRGKPNSYYHSIRNSSREDRKT